MNNSLIREGVRSILRGLGTDLSDPNFAETPDRVARFYAEVLAGAQDTDRQIDALLSATFPCNHSQMIVARDVETWGICPHHLLPVRYNVTVGYVPDGKGSRVLGVSKLSRLVDILVKRPVLQEQIVNDITAALSRLPGCSGAGCVMQGEHGCMRVRGIKQQNATILTSSLTGVLLDEPSARAEFMALMR